MKTKLSILLIISAIILYITIKSAKCSDCGGECDFDADCEYGCGCETGSDGIDGMCFPE